MTAQRKNVPCRYTYRAFPGEPVLSDGWPTLISIAIEMEVDFCKESVSVTSDITSIRRSVMDIRTGWGKLM